MPGSALPRKTPTPQEPSRLDPSASPTLEPAARAPLGRPDEIADLPVVDEDRLRGIVSQERERRGRDRPELARADDGLRAQEQPGTPAAPQGERALRAPVEERDVALAPPDVGEIDQGDGNARSDLGAHGDGVLEHAIDERAGLAILAGIHDRVPGPSGQEEHGDGQARVAPGGAREGGAPPEAQRRGEQGAGQVGMAHDEANGQGGEQELERDGDEQRAKDRCPAPERQGEECGRSQHRGDAAGKTGRAQLPAQTLDGRKAHALRREHEARPCEVRGDGRQLAPRIAPGEEVAHPQGESGGDDRGREQPGIAQLPEDAQGTGTERRSFPGPQEQHAEDGQQHPALVETQREDLRREESRPRPARRPLDVPQEQAQARERAQDPSGPADRRHPHQRLDAREAEETRQSDPLAAPGAAQRSRQASQEQRRGDVHPEGGEPGDGRCQRPAQHHQVEEAVLERAERYLRGIQDLPRAQVGLDAHLMREILGEVRQPGGAGVERAGDGDRRDEQDGGSGGRHGPRRHHLSVAGGDARREPDLAS